MRQLYDFQNKAVQFILKNKGRAALFVEMRLGKTLTTIRALSALDVKKVLIVSPYSALQGWTKELSFEESPFVEILGSKEEKLFALCNSKFSTYYLTNKESFLSIGEALYKFNWDAIILDESTFIKNPKSKISKFYTSHFQDVKYKMILTGTPAPENELEYFQQLKFINANKGIDNFWQFRHTCFVPDFMGYSWQITANGRSWLTQRLRESAFVLTRREAGIGLHKIYETRNIQMPTKIKTLYNRIKKTFTLNDNKETIFATQQFIWLRRACSGFEDNKLIDLFKIDELVRLLKGELARQQVVVWAVFIKEVSEIYNTLRYCNISCDFIYGEVPPADRVQIIDKFKAGKLQVLIAQPETVKHGVDLACADTMIYFSNPLGLETRQQSEDRIVNTTKSAPVLIIDLLTEGTIDAEIYQSLKLKESKVEMMKRLLLHFQRNNAL